MIACLMAAPLAILAILYSGGFLGQILGNYAAWKQGGGVPGDGTSPVAASPDFFTCLTSVLRPPYGVYGVLICIGLLAILLLMVWLDEPQGNGGCARFGARPSQA